jgi:hypothetical protein
MRKRFAVDLDGTLAAWDGAYHPEKIGAPLPGAKEFLTELMSRGEVIIHSCRCSEGHQNKLKAAAGIRALRLWMEEHELPYTHIWTGEDGSKPVADAYIDDRAVPCLYEQNGRSAYKAALLRIDQVLLKD